MYEVKAMDALEASFDAVTAREAVGELRAEMAELKDKMDKAAVAAGRPALSGAKAETGGKAFVEQYLRKGVEGGIELKSFNGGTGPEGGYAVPREIDERIDATLRTISPIRGVANVVKVGTAGYRKLVTTGGAPSGWVAETDARVETATPVFREIAPSFGELYANPAASQAMLDDAAFDVEEWLAGEIATEFARAEGQAFVAGNGTNKPKGFLTYATTNESDAARAFGSLQYVAAGAAGGFAASNPQDRLIDLVQSLRAPYRQGATFVMNASTLAVIRKFKTADGAFLWQPGLGDGVRTRFDLIKRYGEGGDAEVRRITRPAAGGVRVGVAGVERMTGWTLAPGGTIAFTAAPAAGQAITAGFRFDVPVRFAEDRLEVSLAAVTAGDAPSVPLIEVREA